MTEALTFGEQRVLIEAPDLVRIEFRGAFGGTSVGELLRWLSAFCEGKERVYLLVDLTACTGISSAAREALHSSNLNFRVMWMLCWGASFTIRSVVGMMTRARQLLGLTGHGALRFFASEREARAVIEAERRRASIPPAK